MDPGAEMVTIVDERDHPVGAARRSEMRSGRMLHRAAYVLVFNHAGEIFVQKRTPTKDVYPGYFDAAAGGVVLEGESYDEAAARELAEELGISDVPLTFCAKIRYEDSHVRLFGAVYRCVSDGPMRLQVEEIESGTFLSPDEVLRRACTELYTPDSLIALERCLELRR